MKRIIILAMLVILPFSALSQSISVEVRNKKEMNRRYETVELNWSDIEKTTEGIRPENTVVKDDVGIEVPSQVTYDGKLIFQVSVGAKSSVRYTVSKGIRGDYPIRAFGRAVPERLDFWAWENNRIAYRMFGPALQSAGEISNGIGIWAKSTQEMVIDKWTKPDVDYHKDNGEGLDFYKVGRTLGAGAMAPTNWKRLFLGENFVKAELLDMGPVRVTCRLSYAPFEVEGKGMVTETKIISLDANTYFNRVTEIYDGKFSTMSVAVGIVMHEESSKGFFTGWAYAHREPEDKQNGTIYIGVVMPKRTTLEVVDNHITLSGIVKAGVPFTYSSGAGWSKGGIESWEQWRGEITAEAMRMDFPLTITIK